MFPLHRTNGRRLFPSCPLHPRREGVPPPPHQRQQAVPQPCEMGPKKKGERQADTRLGGITRTEEGIGIGSLEGGERHGQASPSRALRRGNAARWGILYHAVVAASLVAVSAKLQWRLRLVPGSRGVLASFGPPSYGGSGELVGQSVCRASVRFDRWSASLVPSTGTRYPGTNRSGRTRHETSRPTSIRPSAGVVRQ